ncbi:MAG: hypothetical protein WC700_14955 [Gemmatimonadaceae bacterium]|jgi:hypothetical protein
MTKEELAAALDGSQYNPGVNMIPNRLDREVKASLLVVAYGASDNLLEFEGAWHDEFDANDECVVMIDTKGPIATEREDSDDDETMLAYLLRKRDAKHYVEALWSPDEPGNYSWIIAATVPAATFEIYEDEEHFCRGIVFSVEDVAKDRA